MVLSVEAWFGAVSRPRPGEQECGDAVVVMERAERRVLALVDALGHGPKAAHAARLAVGALEAAPPGGGAEALLHAVHAALRGSRGAAMTLLTVDGAGVEAIGVGNVALRVRGGSGAFVPGRGVLGGALRSMRAARFPVPEGGLRVVLHSDGLSSRFELAAYDTLTPPEAARALLDRHAKSTDDAAVLVADLRAGGR